MSDSSRWVELALEDEQMAELAYKAGLYNQACFHSQQGGEKCLKALLLQTEGKFPKTHSLTELLLLASLKDENLLKLKNDCLYLDQFYVPTRYPDAPLGNLPEGQPNKEDAKKALQVLTRIVKLITKKLAE
jgi:HEPN domain-containing protein